MVGLVVVAIGMSFGAMHGYAINPGARFRSASVHGSGGLPQQRHHRRAGLVGTGRGAAARWSAGAALYDFGIRRFLRP